MSIGELKYKKSIIVTFIGILLLSLAIEASCASELPQVGNNTPQGINSNVNLTAGAGPGKATLYLPLGFISTGKPTYIWSKVETTQFYNLKVTDSSDTTVINQWFKAEDLKPDKKSRLSATLSTTLLPGDYKWQIATWSSSGITLSDVNPFTVCTSTSVPAKPVLISPKGSIGTDEPIYIWNPVQDASRYHLKVADTTSPNNPIIDQWFDAADVVSNRGCAVKLALPNPGSYRWWVQAENCRGKGSWSNFMSFTFTPKLPGKVSPISPDGLISTRTPVFVWTASPSATKYHLTVESKTDPVFDEWYLAEDVTQGDKCYVMSPIILPFDDVDFFWKVQAANDLGSGPESSYVLLETECSGGEKTKTASRFF